MHSLAVDIYLYYEPLQAKFTSLYRFENPSAITSKKAFVSLSVDNVRVEGLEVTLNGRNLSNPAQPFELAVAPSSKGDLMLQGSITLGSYPLVEIRYPLTHTVPWAGDVSSIRITVHFPELISPDQWAEVSPQPDYFDGFKLTWRMLDTEPSGELRLSLIHPSLWERIVELKARLVMGEARADEYYELGTLYRTLALALPVGSPGFERFYRQAVAYLEEARRMNPALYKASLDLAALYRQKAFPPDGSINAPYLALCIKELEKALEAGAPKPSFAWSLQELYIAMGQELLEDEQFEKALIYFDKAFTLSREGFTGPKSQEELQSTVVDTYALWARQLVAQRKYGEALDLILKGPGPAFFKLLGIRLPLCKAARTVVIMKPGEREVTCTCTPGPLFNALDDDLKALRTSLPPTAEFRESNGKLVLRMKVPFSNTDELRKGLQEMRGFIPVRGEFGACLAGLTGTGIQWNWEPEFMGRRLEFKEQIDLSQAQALIELEKSAIRRREGELGKGGVFKTKPLEELALSLCRAAGEGWYVLRENTTLEYELVLDSGVRQSWYLKPGDIMLLERELWEPYPWVKPAFGLAVSTLGVLLIILVLRISLKARGRGES